MNTYDDCVIIQPCVRMIGKNRALLVDDYDAGDYIVPAGFQFDGATIPRLVWSILGMSPFGSIIGPACGHDLPYANNGWLKMKDGSWENWPEKKTDEYFYHRCQATNVEMNWLQERLVRRAVILFGDYDTDGTSQVAKWNRSWLRQYNASRYNASRYNVTGGMGVARATA